MNKYNPNDCLENYLSYSFNELKLDEQEKNILSNPNKEIKVELSIRMDDNKLKRFQGYRVQHNNFCGPFKGGLRFHPSVDSEHCKALAFAMTWKTALFELPLGGGKGGINCNPKELSENEIEKITKQFTNKIYNDIGIIKDIPAPDVGTGEREMSWIFSEYSKNKGFSPGVVTGKPLILEGIEGRKESTGWGVYKSVELLAKENYLNKEDTRIIIQGFGNVAQYAAKYLFEKKYRIIAISDSKNTIYNEEGLDIKTLLDEKKCGDLKKIKDSKIEKKIKKSEDIFSFESDFIIPAAMENSINKKNMKILKTSYIIEGANLPITCEANSFLEKKGVIIIPDIFANAGGVFVSYLEWSGNQSKKHLRKKEVFSELENKFNHVWKKISKIRHEKGISYRDASYFSAVKRVHKAMKLKGFL